MSSTEPHFLQSGEKRPLQRQNHSKVGSLRRETLQTQWDKDVPLSIKCFFWDERIVWLFYNHLAIYTMKGSRLRENWVTNIFGTNQRILLTEKRSRVYFWYLHEQHMRTLELNRRVSPLHCTHRESHRKDSASLLNMSQYVLTYAPIDVYNVVTTYPMCPLWCTVKVRENDCLIVWFIVVLWIMISAYPYITN